MYGKGKASITEADLNVLKVNFVHFIHAFLTSYLSIVTSVTWKSSIHVLSADKAICLQL